MAASPRKKVLCERAMDRHGRSVLFMDGYTAVMLHEEFATFIEQQNRLWQKTFAPAIDSAQSNRP